MANQTEAISWILAMDRQLNLSIQNLSWIKEIFPDYSDVFCSVNIGGRSIEGWGSSSDEDAALCKAFSEVVERIVVIQAGKPTSNGFAAHYVQASASENAKSELIERDLFLCHFLTETPFKEIDIKLQNWQWADRLMSWARSEKVEVKFFYLGENGVLSLISGFKSDRKFGFIVGTSVKANFEQAAIAAFIEAGRRASIHNHSERVPLGLNLRDFECKKSPGFNDHGNLGLNIEYAERARKLFYDDPAKHSMAKYGINPTMINALDMKMDYFGVDSCPFVVSFASCQMAQGMWLGTTKRENINMCRLENFSGSSINFEKLNPLPHFFA